MDIYNDHNDFDLSTLEIMVIRELLLRERSRLADLRKRYKNSGFDYLRDSYKAELDIVVCLCERFKI